MKVYIKEHPRSLALATEDHFLIFRYFGSDSSLGIHGGTASSSQTNLEANAPTTGNNNGSTNANGNHSTNFEAKCIAEFKKISNVDVESYTLLSRLECHGFLGLINIDRDIYLCTITRQSEVASPRPGESICRIYAVEFHCLTRSDWDFVTLDGNGYPIDVGPGGSGPGSATPGSLALQEFEHPCTSIRKLLSNGSFYYSTNFDLTSVMQNR